MDLSFAREPMLRVTAVPTGLAVLLVGVASRQAASPAARTTTMLLPVVGGGLLAPQSGAFHAATAAALTAWQVK